VGNGLLLQLVIEEEKQLFSYGESPFFFFQDYFKSQKKKIPSLQAFVAFFF
jgi:hypothetical protein